MEVPLFVAPDQFSVARMAILARTSPFTNTGSAFPVQYPPKLRMPMTSPDTSGAGAETVPLFRKKRWLEAPQKVLTVNPALEVAPSELIWSGQVGLEVPIPTYPPEEAIGIVRSPISCTLSISLFHMVALRLVVPPVRGYA